MILDDMFMPYGRPSYPEEIRHGVKRCGLTHKQWEKKKRQKRNRKEARRHK